MVFVAGQQFGNYRVVRLLGQGGFAEVYLGEHIHLGMKAAIKVLHTHLTGEAINAFQREAQVIAELAHPHIVRVLDFDLQDGRPFLVLDYAPNQSLREKHPPGTRVPLTRIVSYVQQVASALQYAHERKLIHRDVKPGNMLVGKQDEILLSDFGIVTIAHSTCSMNTQSSMGTLAYMAPEQIQGKPRPQSDQYSLAVAVYQWLCGSMPFQGSSMEIIAQQLGAPPPSLRTLMPNLAEEVEQVVMTALAKDHTLRFESVQAFADALSLTSGLAPTSPSSSLESSDQSTKPASVATTQPASQAVVAPAPQLPPIQPVRTALALPLTPTKKQRRPMPVSSSRRRIIRGVICALVIILVSGSTIWFTGLGNSFFNSSHHLSAMNTGVQAINISPKADKDNSLAPILTVVSAQFARGQTVFHLAWQGVDTSQCQQYNSTFANSSPESGNTYDPTSHLDSLDVVTFAVAPHAGQARSLHVGIQCPPGVTSNYHLDFQIDT